MNVLTPALTNKTVPATDTKDDGVIVPSIPANFQDPNLSKSGQQPSAQYKYVNEDGSLACIIARYDTGSKKSFCNFTVWRDDTGQMKWRRKAIPENRPLFALNHVVEDPELPVLISEGEKCAEAANLSGFVSTTWIGGSGAVNKTDFSPLKGRDVIILPDADDAGEKAVKQLVKSLQVVDAQRVRVFKIDRLQDEYAPEGARGFDIADAIAAGLDEDRFKTLLNDPEHCVETSPEDEVAKPSIHAELMDKFAFEVRLPEVFALTEIGIVKSERDQKGNDTQVFAGSPLVVLGRTKAAGKNAGWGYLLALRTPAGDWSTLTIPAKLLAGEGKEMREILADVGFIPPQDLWGRRALNEYIAYAMDCPIVEETKRVGWCGKAFALPGDIILPPESGQSLFLDMESREHYLKSCGTMNEWRKLAKLAAPNSRAIFAICAALAPPLLRPLGKMGGGFHFFGQSSRGKTTLLTVAGSVWGGGGNDGFVRNWHMTANGAEGLISDHNDILLPLDELTSVAPEMAADLYYMLANGHGKARAKKDGSSAASNNWKSIVLSSGENTAARQIEKGRSRVTVTGGLAVRMVDIPIEFAPGESFEDWSTCVSPGAFSENLSTLAKKNYGHAGPAFVRALVEDYDSTLSHAENILSNQIASLTQEGDDPQVHRVAERFALAATAGILAIEFAILPVDVESIEKATSACFEAWKTQRGGARSEEWLAALKHLKLFFETQGQTRFEHITSKGRAEEDGPGRASTHKVHDRCGFLEEADDGSVTYYVLPEAWKAVICADHSPDLMSKVLRQSNALISGEGRHLAKKVRLPDYPNGTRAYVIRPDRLP